MRAPRLAHMPTLAALLEQSNIKFVDVGGRGSAMPQLLPMAAVADYYSCEPDAQEAEQLRQRLPQQAAWRSVTVMTEALASRSGMATLRLTKKEGMSSLLEPDLAVTSHVYEGQAFEVVSTLSVPAITLDEAADRYRFQEACFLKLDTQGTELDILKSGRTLLGTSVVGVYVEALFHPFYKTQPLFSELDTFLREEGFSLFGLYRTMMRRARHRHDTYSRRMVVWAHCLYFREPASVIGTDPVRSARDVLRLLSLTLAFKYFDLTFELLDLGAQRHLFPKDAWREVVEEVDKAVQEVSRRLIRKANQQATMKTQEPTDNEPLLARSFRDNRYFDEC